MVEDPVIVKVVTFKKSSFYLLCIFLFSFIISCKTSSDSASQSITKSNKSLSYLALGDSYTIGEAIDSNKRWPVLLQKELIKQGIPTNSPYIIAKTGWRTDELIKAILNASIESEVNKKYDLVSILIGVNNQYQGRDIQAYKSDLVALVSLAQAHSKRGLKGVFAFSIPDYGVTPFAAEKEESISGEITEWNNVYKATMNELGVTFYDITPISKKAKNDLSLIAKDELHPSGKMYELWIKKYANSIITDIILPQTN